jgi:hypothetical protein
MLLWLAGFSQPQPVMKIDTTQASIEYWQKWMKDLNEMGVEKKKDTFFVKEEVIRLLKDSVYRKSVYPVKYNWPAVIVLLNNMELKKAFWHLINLYETDSAHRDIIVGTFVLYDSLMDMDKILLSTYYTYAFADPESCRVKNNKPDIFRPDILERKLRTTKEIIGYIWFSRERKKKTG